MLGTARRQTQRAQVKIGAELMSLDALAERR